jgi:hypothetical protein
LSLPSSVFISSVIHFGELNTIEEKSIKIFNNTGGCMFEVTEKAGSMIKSVMEKQNAQQNTIRVLLQDG